MSTEWTTDPVPSDAPDWASLSRQLAEIYRVSKVSRRDCSGLWVAADGIPGKKPIWREQGLTLVTPKWAVADIRPELGAATMYDSWYQEQPRTLGGQG